MAATQTGGFLNLNSGAVATANASCSMQTWRTIPLRGNAGLHLEMTAAINAMPLANQIFEFGLFFTTAAGAAPTAPTDGVWFQLTSAGLIGVLAYNGTTTQTGTLLASITANTNNLFKMIVSESACEFWYDGQFLGEIATPSGNGQPFMTDALPICLQARNSGTVSGTPSLIKFANMHSDTLDMQYLLPYSHQQALFGLSAYQGQDGGTMGTSAAYPNATGATTVTGSSLSQTASIKTGLGGEAGITASTPGVDGWVTAFQNPAGGVNQTPRVLILTGVKISAVNIGAAVASTPSTLSWSVAFGGTQLNSLATAESSSFTGGTVKAARRVPVGLQSWLVGAAIGAQATELYMKFDTPIVVNPGEYIGAVAKFIQGTATASQVIWAVVTFDGYFQ